MKTWFLAASRVPGTQETLELCATLNPEFIAVKPSYTKGDMTSIETCVLIGKVSICF